MKDVRCNYGGLTARASGHTSLYNSAKPHQDSKASVRPRRHPASFAGSGTTVQARAGAAPACAAHVLRPRLLGCCYHYQPLLGLGQGHHPSFALPEEEFLPFGCKTACLQLLLPRS